MYATGRRHRRSEPGWPFHLRQGGPGHRGGWGLFMMSRGRGKPVTRQTLADPPSRRNKLSGVSINVRVATPHLGARPPLQAMFLRFRDRLSGCRALWPRAPIESTLPPSRDIQWLWSFLTLLCPLRKRPSVTRRASEQNCSLGQLGNVKRDYWPHRTRGICVRF
jgi:hypothetical protein